MRRDIQGFFAEQEQTDTVGGRRHEQPTLGVRAKEAQSTRRAVTQRASGLAC